MKANEKLIREMMRLKKRRGNAKNFVVLTGVSLMDVYGTHVIKRKPNTDEAKVLLLHMRNLHLFIDEKQASQFWNRKLHLRVPRKQQVSGDTT